jgi:hypothetical protein
MGFLLWCWPDNDARQHHKNAFFNHIGERIVNLRVGFTWASLVPLVAAWAIPNGAVPIWFRVGLAVIGFILLILSFVPKGE